MDYHKAPTSKYLLLGISLFLHPIISSAGVCGSNQPIYINNPYTSRPDALCGISSSTLPSGSTFYFGAGPVVIKHADGTTTLYTATDTTPGGYGAALIRSSQTWVNQDSIYLSPGTFDTGNWCADLSLGAMGAIDTFIGVLSTVSLHGSGTYLTTLNSNCSIGTAGAVVFIGARSEITDLTVISHGANTSAVGVGAGNFSKKNWAHVVIKNVGGYGSGTNSNGFAMGEDLAFGILVDNCNFQGTNDGINFTSNTSPHYAEIRNTFASGGQEGLFTASSTTIYDSNFVGGSYGIEVRDNGGFGSGQVTAFSGNAIGGTYDIYQQASEGQLNIASNFIYDPSHSSLVNPTTYMDQPTLMQSLRSSGFTNTTNALHASGAWSNDVINPSTVTVGIKVPYTTAWLHSRGDSTYFPGTGNISDDGTGVITGDGNCLFTRELHTGDVLNVPGEATTVRVGTIYDDNDMIVSGPTSASNESFQYQIISEAFDDSSGNPTLMVGDGKIYLFNTGADAFGFPYAIDPNNGESMVMASGSQNTNAVSLFTRNNAALVGGFGGRVSSDPRPGGFLSAGTGLPNRSEDQSGNLNRFLGNAYAVKCGASQIGDLVPVNGIDDNCNEVIGASYAGSRTAPTNGLAVQGQIYSGSTIIGSSVDVPLNGLLSTNGQRVGLVFSTWTPVGVYSLTTTTSTINISASSMTVTLTSSGTYSCSGSYSLLYNGATEASNQFITSEVYRQNNTPGIISGTLLQPQTGAITTLTSSNRWSIMPFSYTTTNLTDVLSLQISITATPSVGSVQVKESNLYCQRLY